MSRTIRISKAERIAMLERAIDFASREIEKAEAAGHSMLAASMRLTLKHTRAELYAAQGLKEGEDVQA